MTEVVTIIGYGSVNTDAIDICIDSEYDEGPEEDPASDWDKVEFYARNDEGEWEQI